MLSSVTRQPLSFRHGCTQPRRYITGAAYRPPLFTQTLVLSDGSTITRLTTSPRASVRLTRDVRNNPLWNPSLSSTGSGEVTGRLARFRDRFASFSETSPSASISLEGTQEADGLGGGSGEGKGKKEVTQAQRDAELDWLVDTSAAAAPKMSERELREANRSGGGGGGSGKKGKK